MLNRKHSILDGSSSVIYPSKMSLSEKQLDGLRDTFSVFGNGFHFPDESYLGFSDKKYLNSVSPVERLLCILLHLQQGEFSYIEYVPKIMKSAEDSGDWSVWTEYACTSLMSFAAPYSFLKEYCAKNRSEILAKGNDELRRSTSKLLSESLALWAVPFMLEINESVEDWEYDEGGVEMFLNLAFLLEEHDSLDIKYFPSYLPDADQKTAELREVLGVQEIPYKYDLQEFRHRVIDMYDTICSRHREYPVETTAFLYGKVYSADETIHRLENALQNILHGSNPYGYNLEFLKENFEATTGIYCKGFYLQDSSLSLDKKKAHEILQSYTDGLTTTKTRPSGARFFFEHQIPS